MTEHRFYIHAASPEALRAFLKRHSEELLQAIRAHKTRPRPMRIYCASPYTSTDPRQAAQNILHAEAVGMEVRALGHVPFVPHIALPPFPALMPIEDQWEPAMRECMSHLVTCDAILLTGRWQQSRGCRAELSAALSLGMKVFFDLAEAGEWVA